MELKIKKLVPNAILPVYATAGAAGADLYSLPDSQLESVQPGRTFVVHTGIAVAIPEGYVGLIYARSGMAIKRGLAPANKVGVIDSDYRGEIMVGLCNHSDKPQMIRPGERIAQLVIMPVVQAAFTEVDNLDETARGEGGFGSTGTGIVESAGSEENAESEESV